MRSYRHLSQPANPQSAIRNPQSVHLIGICGAAMASLAGMLKESGWRVTGSDSGMYPPMSDLLARLGIRAVPSFSESNLEPAPDLVIVGNAISRGNPELEAVLNRRLRYDSMARVVQEVFIRGRESLVVAGTHGKTTTTSLLAWIFHVAGLKSGFLIGGIAENFSSSFRVPAPDAPFFIIEGDEYDTAYFDKGPKFLHYLPESLVLTSVEYDHADIYADLEAVKLQFRRLVNLVPQRGVIVARGADASVAECLARAFCPVETYGFEEACLWRAAPVEDSGGRTRFEVRRAGQRVLRAEMALAGRHNVLNALGASVLALHYGAPPEAVREALATFKNVKRRLELRGEVRGVAVIDDFAHHPTAIGETLAAARLRYPGRRLWAILEPRSNTLRRRVFERELAGVLAAADRAIIAGVFKMAAIPEDERLSPERVVQALAANGRDARVFPSVDAILTAVPAEMRAGDLVVIMSNGGFDNIHERLLAALAD
jgi:UDP-N-acetylmuramate: L-alanyl-gamma-D-glutamyl-meso-diaminopimelate ligase